MAMSEQALTTLLTDELTAAGFDLDKAPKTKKFCAAIAKAVVTETKKATVTVTVTTPAGAGTGTGKIT